MRHVDKVRKYFDRPEKAVFSYSELKVLGIPRNYIKVMLHNMARRGEVYRVRKGWYTFHRDPLVFIFTLPPNTAYYGLGFAAHLYGAWDQVPNPEIITYVAPRKVRSGMYFFMDTPIIIRKISRRMFFGYTLLKCNERLIPVSTPEKTLIDLVYYDYPFMDEILEGLLERVDREKLERMAKNAPVRKKLLKTWNIDM